MSEKNSSSREQKRPSPARSSAQDDRVRGSKAQVLSATLALLTENGLGGVSIDDVSRRSGVAKTTIYRHWRTRSDLILDACAQLSTHQEVPDTGSFKGDLTALLNHIAELLWTAKWSAVMPSIIDAAERDPDLAAIHSQIQQGHATPLREIITRAIRKGELPPDTDPNAMTAALLGPLYYRRWFSREPLDSNVVSGVIEVVIGRF